MMSHEISWPKLRIIYASTVHPDRCFQDYVSPMASQTDGKSDEPMQEPQVGQHVLDIATNLQVVKPTLPTAAHSSLRFLVDAAKNAADKAVAKVREDRKAFQKERREVVIAVIAERRPTRPIEIERRLSNKWTSTDHLEVEADPKGRITGLITHTTPLLLKTSMLVGVGTEEGLCQGLRQRQRW